MCSRVQRCHLPAIAFPTHERETHKLNTTKVQTLCISQLSSGASAGAYRKKPLFCKPEPVLFCKPERTRHNALIQIWSASVAISCVAFVSQTSGTQLECKTQLGLRNKLEWYAWLFSWTVGTCSTTNVYRQPEVVWDKIKAVEIPILMHQTPSPHRNIYQQFFCLLVSYPPAGSSVSVAFYNKSAYQREQTEMLSLDVSKGTISE